MAHSGRCDTIPERWCTVHHLRWETPSHQAVAPHHCPSTMHLSMQGVLSMDAQRWEDRPQAASKNAGGQTLFHGLLACSGGAFGSREPPTDGTCKSAETIVFHTAFLVRSEVHKEDPLLAQKPAANTANHRTPEPTGICPCKSRKVPKQNLPRSGSGHCPAMVKLYPQ